VAGYRGFVRLSCFVIVEFEYERKVEWYVYIAIALLTY
jgi:hypothetical protein